MTAEASLYPRDHPQPCLARAAAGADAAATTRLLLALLAFSRFIIIDMIINIISSSGSPHAPPTTAVAVTRNGRRLLAATYMTARRLSPSDCSSGPAGRGCSRGSPPRHGWIGGGEGGRHEADRAAPALEGARTAPRPRVLVARPRHLFGNQDKA